MIIRVPGADTTQILLKSIRAEYTQQRQRRLSLRQRAAAASLPRLCEEQDTLRSALLALFMAAMDFYAARPSLEMSRELIATLHAMRAAAHEPGANHQAYIILGIDRITASAAATDVNVYASLISAQQALNAEQAALALGIR